MMESLKDFQMIPLTAGGFLAGIIVLLSILRSLIFSSHYNRAGTRRIGKTNLQSWLTWDTLPAMSLGNYIKEGYYRVNKVTGQPFAIPMCGMENTILPPKFLSTLKTEERDDLSLCQAFEDMFNMTVVTGKEGRHDHVEIDVVAKYINPRLTEFLPHMVAQTDFAFENTLSSKPSASNGWKKFNTADLCFDIVFTETARVLAGEDLCRNPDYLRAIIDYSKSFLASGFMWPIRPPNWWPIRNWLYRLFTWRLRRDIRRTFTFILPVIYKRLELLESRSKNQKPEVEDERTMDMIQGLLEMDIPDPNEATPVRHAHRVLHLSFAASAVSSALMMHTIHQLLQTPEHIPSLRQEIQDMLKQHGGWTEKALLEMHLLDSTIRELLRLNPPSVFAGQRTIVSPMYQFDKDLKLPAGTRIAFPVMEIHTDADNYAEPTKFNPYRFVGGRPDSEEKMSAFRITDKFLSFGYGKQACPGRFLAVRQLKLVLAKLFLDYEFQWAGGPSKAPKQLSKQIVEGQIFPDLTTQVEIRKRVD